MNDDLQVSTMKMPKLRDAGGIAEQINLFIDMQFSGTPLLAWTNSENERVTSQAVIREVIPGANNLILAIEFKKDFPKHIKEDQLIFFYDQEKKVLFHSFPVKQKGTFLQIKVNDKVLMKELRANPRQKFEKIPVTVKFVTSFYKQEGGSIEEHAPLLDISETGMGFKIHATKGTSFDVGDKINLVEINKIKLPGPISGKIVHISLQKNSGIGQKKILRVGVAFDKTSSLLSEVMQALALVNS